MSTAECGTCDGTGLRKALDPQDCEVSFESAYCVCPEGQRALRESLAGWAEYVLVPLAVAALLGRR